jgi:S1-C subfamily serine protease
MATAPARRRLSPIAYVLLAVAIAGAGCGHKSPASKDAGGTPRAPALPRSEADRLNLAMVGLSARIGNREVRSSGTVIDGDRGLVLTSAHSVWGASSLKLSTGVAVLHGRIVARSPCDDIALVETQPWVPGLAALPQATGRLEPGRVTAVARSFDDGRVIARPASTVPRGHRLTDNPMLAAVTRALVVRGGLDPAASGGPLLDSAGRVAGVIAAARGSDGLRRAVAVPMSLIRERMRDLRPGSGTVYVGWGAYYRCAPLQHAYAAASYPGFRRRDARLNAPVHASRLRGTGGLDG